MLQTLRVESVRAWQLQRTFEVMSYIHARARLFIYLLLRFIGPFPTDAYRTEYGSGRRDGNPVKSREEQHNLYGWCSVAGERAQRPFINVRPRACSRANENTALPVNPVNHSPVSPYFEITACGRRAPLRGGITVKIHYFDCSREGGDVIQFLWLRFSC